jgi:hypothetical protein
MIVGESSPRGPTVVTAVPRCPSRTAWLGKRLGAAIGHGHRYSLLSGLPPVNRSSSEYATARITLRRGEPRFGPRKIAPFRSRTRRWRRAVGTTMQKHCVPAAGEPGS